MGDSNGVTVQQLQLQNSTQQQPEEPRLNHPNGDLLSGERRQYIDICVPLYKASVKGDWEAAKDILHEHKYLVSYSITENKETALHVAATTQSTKFVKHLVDMMSKEELELQNDQGNTALSLAAAAGNVEMAKIMVEKNRDLLKVRGSQKMMPLYMAALFGKRDMVAYLYGKSQRMATTDDWTNNERDWVFLKCLEVDLFDIALQIFDDYKDMQFPQDRYVGEVLQILAGKPYAFNQKKTHTLGRSIIDSIPCLKAGHSAMIESESTQLLRKIWKRTMEKPKYEIDDIIRGPMITIDNMDMYPSRVLFIAAEMGNSKFLVELIQECPELIWKRNDNRQTIFHIAVSYRHQSIYNLLYEIGSMKDIVTPLTDQNLNNMLHLVGMNAERNLFEYDVLGAALQMQRELLWFKEVEAMIPPSYRKRKNKDGKTPHQLFIENHKDMLTQGEKWMKGTANQCMVVAALITTIVFSVAFTIPGGYDQHTGLPIFLHNGLFIAFVILDAMSLILSSASILMFLSILTSRYAQNDFLESLPKKLLIGLATLFLSIVTMMFAFTVSFFVLYRHKFILIPIIIGIVALVPIFLYGKLHFPLLVDAYRSTYGSTYLFNPKKGMLYYQNPRF